jgi:leader peptidase (prepilin peptidase)/N-methyltransferase
MSMVVGGLLGAGLWFASAPWASRFVARSRRSVVVWSTIVSVLSAVVCRTWGLSWIGAAAVVLVVGFVILAEIDLACRRLPREISYPLATIVLVLVAFSALSEGEARPLVDALIGVVVTTSSMFVLYVMSRGGLGDGDVRLAPALGTAAAFGGIGVLSVTMLVSFVSAGLFVVMGLVLGRMTRSSAIPFGPFLIVGSIVAMLVS